MDVDLEKGDSPSPDGDCGGTASLASEDDGRPRPQSTCSSGGVNSCDRHHCCGLRGTAVCGMFLVSLLFVALAVVLLPRTHLTAPAPAPSADGAAEPSPPPPPLQQTVSVVWTVSLLVCSYLACWTYTLSRTMGAAAVFLRASYPVMLACAAGILTGPVAGMASAHLCTARAAGLLGYALAEHRLHVGSERAAGEAAARTPRRPSNPAVFLAVLATLGLGARAAWLVFFPSNGDEEASAVVAELSVLVWMGLYVWAFLVVCFLLREALVTVGSLERVYFCYMALCILSALAAMVSDWIWVYCLGTEMMAIAAFFGYMIAVNERCKEILAREGRRQLSLA